MRFAGHVFQPLPSGALYWPAQRTLLVADLHLEKMSSFAKRGQMLPPYDTGLTLKRLDADLRSTGAQRLVSLGDMLRRIRSHIEHKPLERVSPLAVPILLDIGKEPIFGEGRESAMADAADELMREALGAVGPDII